MQCRLRARRPRASNKGLRACPLRTEISPVSLNLFSHLSMLSIDFCFLSDAKKRGESQNYSRIPTITRSSASTLLSRRLFFGVCLHWFSKQRHHSHPFMQQQLLRSRYLSSNLIGRPLFSLCETEKIRQTGRKKKTFAVAVRGLCGSIHRKLLFYSSVSSRPKFVLLFRAQCGKAFRHPFYS